jgi:hypothetical protein
MDIVGEECHEDTDSPNRKRQDRQAEVAHEMSKGCGHERFDHGKCHKAFVYLTSAAQRERCTHEDGKERKVAKLKTVASSALLGGRLRSPLESNPRHTMATVATNPVATAATATNAPTTPSRLWSAIPPFAASIV